LPVEELKFSFAERALLSIISFFKSIECKEHQLMSNRFDIVTSYPDWMINLLWSLLPENMIDIEKEVKVKKTLFKSFIINHPKEKDSLVKYASLIEHGKEIFNIQHTALYIIIPQISFCYASESLNSGFIAWGKCSCVKKKQANIE
jgi:hypothetical protein